MSDFNKVAKSYVKMSCSKRQITENNWLFMSVPCINLNDPSLSAPSRCWLCFICNFGNICLWILQLLHCVSCDNLRLNAERHLGCCCVYLVVKKKQLINILVIVVCHFSGAALHLNRLFIETVQESISLSGKWQYLPWCCCCHTQAKSLSTLTPNSSFTQSHVAAHQPLITPGPSWKRRFPHLPSMYIFPWAVNESRVSPTDKQDLLIQCNLTQSVP